MLIVVRATDPDGAEVSTGPLTEKEAILKVWEFKTSEFTQIRTFDADTGKAINLFQDPK